MKACLYCGNNPVPHMIHKFYESFDIAVSPIRRHVFQSFLGSLSDWLTNGIGLALFHTLKPLGLIKINSDINEIKYPRAKVLWEEALRRGIKIEEIKPFGRSIDLYRAIVSEKPRSRNFWDFVHKKTKTSLRGRWIYFMNLPRLEKVATSNLTWVDDKYLLKKKLLEQGLPVAPGGSFATLRSALKTFDALNKPVIVKPRAGSRGRHTTTNIYTEEDFIKAYKIAKKLCYWIMVEEHLFGDVQRGTVVGGKLVGVLGGSPPRVTGDGLSTIEKLIKMKDAIRPSKVKETKVNPYFMQRAGLSIGTILPKDKTVDLSEKIGVNYGGTSYDCTPQTHPDTKAMLVEAGKVLDVSIIGFDFIIPDITKSYKEQKCGIIEANGAPFIQLHHDPLIGESINAAKYVWDLVS